MATSSGVPTSDIGETLSSGVFQPISDFFTQTIPQLATDGYETVAAWVSEYVAPFFNNAQDWFSDNTPGWVWPAVAAFVGGAALIVGVAIFLLARSKEEEGDDPQPPVTVESLSREFDAEKASLVAEYKAAMATANQIEDEAERSKEQIAIQANHDARMESLITDYEAKLSDLAAEKEDAARSSAPQSHARENDGLTNPASLSIPPATGYGSRTFSQDAVPFSVSGTDPASPYASAATDHGSSATGYGLSATGHGSGGQYLASPLKPTRRSTDPVDDGGIATDGLGTFSAYVPADDVDGTNPLASGARRNDGVAPVAEDRMAPPQQPAATAPLTADAPPPEEEPAATAPATVVVVDDNPEGDASDVED